MFISSFFFFLMLSVAYYYEGYHTAKRKLDAIKTEIDKIESGHLYAAETILPRVKEILNKEL